VGSRRTVWVAAVAVVVVLACVVLAGAARFATGLPGAASAQAPSSPPLRVSIYGDSVLLGARNDLLTQFAGQQVTVDAVEDRSLLGAIGLFQNAGPALGDVVVLDLGYNDVADAGVFRSRIDAAMSALAGVKRVIWLNQHDWGPGRAAMNDELTAAASRYPNLDVVDWNAQVAAHPEYVYSDQIHLTPAGQPAMATAVRTHFDQYVASLTPTTTAVPTTVAPTRGSAAPAAAGAAGATPAASTTDDGGIDAWVVIAAAVVVLLVVVLVATIVGRRRQARRRARRAQRRASSSASSAPGSVTGSRQANRSQT
jgi:hypothetical protein